MSLVEVLVLVCGEATFSRVPLRGGRATTPRLQLRSNLRESFPFYGRREQTSTGHRRVKSGVNLVLY